MEQHSQAFLAIDIQGTLHLASSEVSTAGARQARLALFAIGGIITVQAILAQGLHHLLPRKAL
jgi:hypothetical protein